MSYEVHTYGLIAVYHHSVPLFSTVVLWSQELLIFVGVLLYSH